MELIQFPAEDSEWLALQQKVISITEKPIEDLERTEVRALSAVLTPEEQRKLREYRRRNGLEKIVPALPIALKPWNEQRCTQTFGWLSNFVGLVRLIAARIQCLYSYEKNHYADTLANFEPRLLEFLDKNSERPNLSDDLDTFRRISFCIEKVIPSDDGYGLLIGLRDALCSREEELKEMRKKDAEPKGPWPLPAKGWVYYVCVRHIRGNKCPNYKVWARDERQARQRALRKFHTEFPNVLANHWPYRVEEARKTIRGDFSWNQYFENGGKCE